MYSTNGSFFLERAPATCKASKLTRVHNGDQSHFILMLAVIEVFIRTITALMILKPCLTGHIPLNVPLIGTQQSRGPSCSLRVRT